MKTSELTGAALDYAVAKCEGGTNFHYDTVATYWITIAGKDRALAKGWAQSFTPSTDWAQGGVILEREKITVGYERYGAQGGETWDAVKKAFDDTVLWLEYAPTPLIAAMRVFVASRLGNEVDVPEELAALVKGE